MPITITTDSSLNKDFITDRANKIYPVFVDGTPYKRYIPATTFAAGRIPYYQFQATGGTTYEWRVIGGSLPDGLTLSLDGKLSGTPTRTGDFAFTVSCTSGAETKEKDFNLTAHPWRAQWHAERRFGIWASVQPKQYPIIKTTAEVATYEARLTEYNEEEWAQIMFDHNIDLINNGVFTAESFRPWPSTTPSPKEFKASRNYVTALMNACHAKGIKFIGYTAPDHFTNAPTFQSDFPSERVYASYDPVGKSTYSTNEAQFADPFPYRQYQSTNPADTETYRNTPEYFRDGATMLVGKKLMLRENGIRVPTADSYFADPDDVQLWPNFNRDIWIELFKMQIDGLWFDVGAGDPNIIPGLNPLFYLREEVTCNMRYWAPWCIFGINQGTNDAGNQYFQPEIDFVVYEGTVQNFLAETLIVGFEQWNQKKISIDVASVLGNTFVSSRVGDDADTRVKTSAMFIENFKANYEQGATPSVVINAMADGTLIKDPYKPAMREIADFVAAQGKLSEEPGIYIDGNVLTMDTKLGGTIYYTLDGEKPTASSQVYGGPITLTDDCIIKAVSQQSGKALSIVNRKTYRNASKSLDWPDLIPTITSPVSGNSLVKETRAYYRGMTIIVGNRPIQLCQVGRYGATAIDREIIVRKKVSGQWILRDTFYATGAVQSNGFKYSNIIPIKLQAGGEYLIALKENNTDNYASNSMSAIPQTRGFRITGKCILNTDGEVRAVTDDGKGQFLDLKFKFLKQKVSDKVKGATVVFKLNSSPYSQFGYLRSYYPGNAADGDVNTYSKPDAGGYTYYQEFDIGYLTKLTYIEVEFFNAIPTEIQMNVSPVALTSTTASRQIRIGTKFNNYSNKIRFDFAPTYARYVQFRSMKPDGAGQIGLDAMIRELKAGD